MVGLQETNNFCFRPKHYFLLFDRYQVLAVATDAKTKEESQSIKSGKKVAVSYKFYHSSTDLPIKVGSLCFLFSHKKQGASTFYLPIKSRVPLRFIFQ